MADRPATQTQPLTRAQITEWLGSNPRMVRWFEAAIRDISSILPDASEANANMAEAAQVTADAARIVADDAMELAEQSQAEYLVGAVAELRELISALSRRIDDLEQGPTP